MSIFDSIDFSRAELPGWINNLVALARPAALTMTVAIPSLGAFTVGTVAFKWPRTAMAMADASTSFLKGIPEAGWGAIVAIALGYTAAKTAEVMKTHAPRSPADPETDFTAAEASPAPEEVPPPPPAPVRAGPIVRNLNVPVFSGTEIME